MIIFYKWVEEKDKLNTEIDDIEFKEDYSGDKVDKRLVYLISISNKPVVVKISQTKEQYHLNVYIGILIKSQIVKTKSCMTHL